MSKNIMRRFKINELSAVDNPAQVHAKMTIMKRATAAPSLIAIAFAKYVGTEDGAHTFEEVLAENKFSEAIWPMCDALTQAIRSILGDKSISSAERETKITTSVQEFLESVRAIEPDVEMQLAKLIAKRNGDMPTIEELQTEVATLKGQVTKLNTDLAEATINAVKAISERDEAVAKLEKSASDEVIVLEGETIRKSVVGDAAFAGLKAAASAIEKANDRAETAILEKRAGEEFGHVVGTAAEKAAVLKFAKGASEEVGKSLEAIMTAAEKLTKAGFETLGHQHQQVRKSATDFEAKVSEIQKRDGSTRLAALEKAPKEFPEEFKAYQSAGQAAN